MNDRIKELCGKALDKAVPYTWTSLDHVEVEKVMNELAELIIRECSSMAYDGPGSILEHYGLSRALDDDFDVEGLAAEVGLTFPHITNTSNPIDFPVARARNPIAELSKQAMDYAIEQYGPQRRGESVWNPLTYEEKFAELIINECTQLLFAESERLYAYASECDIMRHSDEAELCAEKCMDNVTMIEEHFGVE